MFGSFGSIPIQKATMLNRSRFFPVAEADVVLGLPSLQAVSRKLEDIELALSFYGDSTADDVTVWQRIASSREAAVLVIGGKPQGRWIVTALTEEISHAISDRIVAQKLRVTFKEEGAFLWAGNYSPYEPPPVARRQAEQGLGGLLDGLKGWLR
jgi:hypothetical protein